MSRALPISVYTGRVRLPPVETGGIAGVLFVHCYFLRECGVREAGVSFAGGVPLCRGHLWNGTRVYVSGFDFDWWGCMDLWAGGGLPSGRRRRSWGRTSLSNFQEDSSNVTSRCTNGALPWEGLCDADEDSEPFNLFR